MTHIQPQSNQIILVAEGKFSSPSLDKHAGQTSPIAQSTNKYFIFTLSLLQVPFESQLRISVRDLHHRTEAAEKQREIWAKCCSNFYGNYSTI